VNCESAVRMLDDFLHDEVNQRDRDRLEEHLARCDTCARELRRRPALERQVRRALAASVQPLYISADASNRIVRASEESLMRADRARRTLLTARTVAGALAVLLVTIGLLALLGQIPVSSNLRSVSLLPAKRLPPAGAELEAASRQDRLLPLMETPTLSQIEANMLIEPREMHARELFTMTVYVQSDMPEPLEAIDLDLDIRGPAGHYRFELSFGGPLPAEGTSVFRVTPDLLARPCEERYLMSPTEIFAVPGTYTVRATLLYPVAVSE
jgi:hypothetical protein